MGRERNEQTPQPGSGGQEISEDIFPALDDPGPSDAPEETLPRIRPFVGRADPTPESAKTVTRIEIPVRTILTIVLALVAIWVLIKVLGILLLVFLAFLLATAMLPLAKRLENRGIPSGIATVLIFAGLIGAIVGFFGIILPPLIEQGQNIITNAPDYLHRFEGFIGRYPSLDKQYQQLKTTTSSSSVSSVTLPFSGILQVGAGVVGRVLDTFFVLVLTFYLMLEGRRSWAFLSRYFAPHLRYRMERAYPEITRVISGYILGQTINSVSSGVFVFITLTALGVPEPLLLAVLAAVFDAVPIVGFPVATIPAFLLALTVSWQTALIVLILYIIYQQFENYVMVPRVFGNTLQVSALSILVGVLVGGQLLGVIGIILSLPITAAIPVLERVWSEQLPEDVASAEA